MKFVKNNGLTIALAALFLFSYAGQLITGWAEYNNEQKEHGSFTVGIVEYLWKGHFWEATFENWESEFLQMFAYVMLTVFLYQKGSSESNEPGTVERVDVLAGASYRDENVPWPVRKGGIARKVYENSLGLALFLLFFVSFLLHAAGGASAYSQEEIAHGGTPVSLLEYLETSRFWFESFQNWQSEFLSVAVMVVFTVFLRQKGSPESKPVDAPHFDTGTD